MISPSPGLASMAREKYSSAPSRSPFDCQSEPNKRIEIIKRYQSEHAQ